MTECKIRQININSMAVVTTWTLYIIVFNPFLTERIRNRLSALAIIFALSGYKYTKED
jgi:hypothetical protein